MGAALHLRDLRRPRTAWEAAGLWDPGVSRIRVISGGFPSAEPLMKRPRDDPNEDRSFSHLASDRVAIFAHVFRLMT